MTEAAAPSQATARSAGLRARLAVARTLQPSSRGQDFRRAMTKKDAFTLAFSDIATLPDWLSWNQDDRDTLALATAILYHRPAIDRELSGAKLGALADAIGRVAFDHYCSEEFDGTIDAGFLSDQFPRPEDLPVIGVRLIYSSLPKALSQTFPAAIGDDEAGKLVAFAEALTVRMDAEMQAV
jgi:hypothetical protein